MCGNGLQRRVPTQIIFIGERSSWSKNLYCGNVSLCYRVCFEIVHKATHCLKRQRQGKKIQHKSTYWDGAKEEHQMIIKDERDALDLPMDEPN